MAKIKELNKEERLILLEYAKRKSRGHALLNAEIEDYSVIPEYVHDGQRRVWNSEACDIVACAGTQGGKTRIQSHWLLRELQRCLPAVEHLGRGVAIYAGPTLSYMQSQVIPLFRNVFEIQHKLGSLVMSPKPIFTFSPVGLMKLYGRLDLPVSVHFAYTNDSSNLESVTAICGVWDEAGMKDNKLESYQAFNRRLVLARSLGFGRRLFGTTPYQWGWFKSTVVDNCDGVEMELINWPSWLNPGVNEESCRRELQKGMPLWQWQMMYLGQFTRPAGLIYDVVTPLHTVQPFLIDGTYAQYPGVDFGGVNTAAVIVAEKAGVVYVVAEYHPGRSLGFAEHVQNIRGRRPLRPGAGGSHQESGWREAFAMHGLSIKEPPVNDVEIQIQAVYEMFVQNRLFIFNTCTKLLDELGTYSRRLDEQMQPTDEINDKASYHLLDSLRYIVTMLNPPKRNYDSGSRRRSVMSMY